MNADPDTGSAFIIRTVHCEDNPISPVHHRKHVSLDEIDSVIDPRFEAARDPHGHIGFLIDIDNIAAVADRRINRSVVKRLIP